VRTVERSRVSTSTRTKSGAVPRRAGIPGQAATRKPEPESGLEYWGRVVFHSIGVGALALALLFLLVLLGVGVYGLIVWSLTGWDLASIDWKSYESTAKGVLWLVFATGTGVGLWFFSGAAWKLIREWGRKRRPHSRPAARR
jgi:hypothetical protein